MFSWLKSFSRQTEPGFDIAVNLGWPGPRTGAGVLFLDFDGVMHPAESGTFCNLPHLDRVLSSFPSIDVVLSTNWRINASREQLLSHFPTSMRSRVVDVTPVTSELAFERQRECEAYIADKCIPFAIALDDDPSLFAPGSSLLMLLDRYVGLDSAGATALIYRLARLQPQ